MLFAYGKVVKMLHLSLKQGRSQYVGAEFVGCIVCSYPLSILSEIVHLLWFNLFEQASLSKRKESLIHTDGLASILWI